MAYYRKENPNFDAKNFDSWKHKMTTHLIYMGIDYQIIIKRDEELKAESKIDDATKDENKLFHFNMVVMEALINAL